MTKVSSSSFLGPWSSVPKQSEDADDTEDAEAPVSIPSRMMDVIDVLRRFAGAHDETKDALNALVGYEKSVHPLVAKRTQAKMTSFFTRKQIHNSLQNAVLVLFHLQAHAIWAALVDFS